MIRVGETSFRMIMAAKGSTDPDGAFRRWTESLSAIDPAEARTLRPLRLVVVTAGPGESVETLAQRMVVPDKPVERFLVLNGLERGATLRAGQTYKVVVE